jgi:hypothetical protein
MCLDLTSFRVMEKRPDWNMRCAYLVRVRGVNMYSLHRVLYVRQRKRGF